MKVAVLNANIEVGDEIAWAVRDGNCGEIRMGTVVELKDTGRTGRRWRPDLREIEEFPVIHVKARITATSGYATAGNVARIEKRDRIVKL